MKNPHNNRKQKAKNLKKTTGSAPNGPVFSPFFFNPFPTQTLLEVPVNGKLHHDHPFFFSFWLLLTEMFYCYCFWPWYFVLWWFNAFLFFFKIFFFFVSCWFSVALSIEVAFLATTKKKKTFLWKELYWEFLIYTLYKHAILFKCILLSFINTQNFLLIPLFFFFFFFYIYISMQY